MTKKAVLYARVSKDDRGTDGRNLAGQIAMCQEYTQTHGLQTVAELSEDDRGASGAAFELPGLNRALEMARKGEFDVLVVRELDRLSRSLAKQLVVEEEFRRHGVLVEYVLGEYPDTPEGNLMKNVRATIAEYEREKISERNTRGRRQKVKAGHVLAHGKPKYGYRLADVEDKELVIREPDGTQRRVKRESADDGLETGKCVLVIHEPEARIVRLIFEWATKGDETGQRLSSMQIARRLTEMGVPTWADIHAPTMRKKGKRSQWYTSCVLKILHNETYIGKWYYGRRNNFAGKDNPPEHWLLVQVPPLVSEDTWHMAHKQLRQNKTMAKRNTKHAYLLRGLLKCGWCGCSMRGSIRISHGRHYRYYNCLSQPEHTAHGRCGLPGFRVDQVDTVVWNWVRSFLSEPTTLIEGLKLQQAEREKANKPLRERLAVIDDLLADNRAKLDRALDKYLEGDLLREMLVSRVESLKATIGSLEGERTDLLAQLETQTINDEQVATITEFAHRVAQGLDQADRDFEARRKLIELLEVRVTLTVENDEKVVYVRSLIDTGVLPIVDPISRS